MNKKIKKEDVCNCIKNGGVFLGNLALNFYGETLNQVGERAFFDAINIGIENTFATLYEANVDDKTILSVVTKHWGIDMKEAEDFLVFEKQEAAIRSLKQYLKLQGYSKKECINFLREHQAVIKIRNNNDLWKLKDNPEKLLKAVKDK